MLLFSVLFKFNSVDIDLVKGKTKQNREFP